MPESQVVGREERKIETTNAPRGQVRPRLTRPQVEEPEEAQPAPTDEFDRTEAPTVDQARCVDLARVRLGERAAARQVHAEDVSPSRADEPEVFERPQYPHRARKRTVQPNPRPHDADRETQSEVVVEAEPSQRPVYTPPHSVAQSDRIAETAVRPSLIGKPTQRR